MAIFRDESVSTYLIFMATDWHFLCHIDQYTNIPATQTILAQLLLGATLDIKTSIWTDILFFDGDPCKYNSLCWNSFPH